MTRIERLIELYNQSSKHSQYQILASNFDGLFPAHMLRTCTRHERERFSFILTTIDFQGKSVLDIGGNTGFFSFEAVNYGAAEVHFYEGNPAHAAFVGEAVQLFGICDKLSVHPSYYTFEQKSTKQYDVALLLNVLHHIGDDYGDKNVGIEQAKTHILRQLNAMSHLTTYIVFQMGFNWKGDRNLCLFPNGTKEEMIDYICKGSDAYWEPLSIAVAEQDTQGNIVYRSCNETNIQRNDKLGEFLNRPLFIMKSRLLPQ